MEARDLITLVRRRAGLSQRELAERLDRQQPTIARWERGDQEPSYRAVQDVMRACGVQHGLALFTYDAQDVSLAIAQLRKAPLDRFELAGRDQGLMGRTIKTIATGGLRVLIAGEAAALLHGSPLTAHSGVVEVVCQPEDRERAERELVGHAVRFVDQPAGTRGYRDLIAGSEHIALDDASSVAVVGLVDLIRIALSDSEDPAAGRKAIALDGALRARRGARVSEPEQPAAEAQEKAELWLSRQRPI